MRAEDYTECKQLCNDVLSTSNKIQSVAVINKMGRLVERSTKQGYSDQFTDKLNEMLFMQCVLQVSMGKDFDEQYGPINYYVSERANATSLTFPMGDNVVFLTVSKNASPISLAKKVANILNGSIKQSSMNLEENKILVQA